MGKVKETIEQLDQLLDSLSDEDRMEVYSYLSGKMMRHLFGEELSDEQLLGEALGRTGVSPFGEPIAGTVKKDARNKDEKNETIDLDEFIDNAIYDLTAEDVRRLTLRVEMHEIEPVVWREVIVPSNLNLESFGHILEDVMGWDGYHLHQFIKGHDYYGIPDEEFGAENPFAGLFGYSPVKNHDSRNFTVGDVLSHKRSWIDYEYDFGDSWLHRVTVVDSHKYKDGEEQKVVLTDGANACPPEDCGGVWGYYEMLDALKKPRSKRAKEFKEWLGGDFDPTEFDLEFHQVMVDGYNKSK